MEYNSILKVKVALAKLIDKLEKIEEVSEKELIAYVDEWHSRSEILVHQLNLKKLELRKEEFQRQK